MDDAPAFQDIQDWVNTDSLTLDELQDRNVLLLFWRYASVTCQDVLDPVKQLWERYGGDAFTVIGVHSPAFDFEREPANVRDAVDRMDVPFPVALDNENTTWKLYGGRYWPRHVLIDYEGRIRHETVGDGGRVRLEERLRRLIRWNGSDPDDPVFDGVSDRGAGTQPLEAAISPAIHAGVQRGGDLGNAEQQSRAPYTRTMYADPGDHRMNRLYVNGQWTRENERLTLENVGREDACYAAVRCSARTAHAVMGSRQRPVRVNVTLDGDPVPAPIRGDALEADANGTYVHVDRPDTYELVDREDITVSELGLHPRDPGFQLYVLTFE